MDPNATLEMFIDALKRFDYETATEYHGYLKEWLERGGFEPKWRGHKGLFDGYNPRTGLVDIDIVMRTNK